MFSQDQTDLERIGLQIIFVLLILSSIGLIMVYSSSYIYAKDVYGSSAYFFLRQLAYFMIGLSVAFLVSKTKFNFWMKYGLYINLLCTILLISSIIPG
ncbi:MAG: FtsW/RodA/SpoVE family cell cycle protein, partial [Bdellovibrionota bacterium]|nr:FtsW/RodA/SpoVE family cell cycle protein [Bdellovibrionota bacterium]